MQPVHSIQQNSFDFVENGEEKYKNTPIGSVIIQIL